VGELQLQVAESHPACTVLGPGTRFVLWVQGCPLNCRECVSPQWIPFAGGQSTTVTEVAERILATPVGGLTLSGGEPFAQAAALTRLVELLRARRDLSVMSYSGYTIEHLRAHGSPDQHRLLSQLDILVDGPYLAARHADLRWRGSANQRLHFLTDRHRPEPADDTAGLQFELAGDGGLRWLGVPVQPGFRSAFERAFRVTPEANPQEQTR
jgi:anaerobic ribonucleoside-triphosphate reductase activating protein